MTQQDAGINHKEFGVTSEGVVVYLDVALRSVLNINPHKCVLDSYHVCSVLFSSVLDIPSSFLSHLLPFSFFLLHFFSFPFSSFFKVIRLL